MLYIAYWTVQATVFQQLIILTIRFYQIIIRGGSRAAATSKMERFVIMSQRMYFYSSKLRLIVTKGGANSADLDGLGFKLNL